MLCFWIERMFGLGWQIELNFLCMFTCTSWIMLLWIVRNVSVAPLSNFQDVEGHQTKQKANQKASHPNQKASHPRSVFVCTSPPPFVVDVSQFFLRLDRTRTPKAGARAKKSFYTTTWATVLSSGMIFGENQQKKYAFFWCGFLFFEKSHINDVST